MLQTRNKLIEGLAGIDELLHPYVGIRVLQPGDLVFAAGQEITHVILVESGFASVTWPDAKNGVDVAMVGREGILGAGASYGMPMALFSVVARSPLLLHQVPALAFDRALSASPELRTRVFGFASALLRQIAQSAFANARLTVEQRVARWLAMGVERLDSRTVQATHDELATAVGCRRAGVTVAMHCLEANKLVRSMRGKVVVLDQDGLARFASGQVQTQTSDFA
jgi:CRP-like cAMP-binding protein